MNSETPSLLWYYVLLLSHLCQSGAVPTDIRYTPLQDYFVYALDATAGEKLTGLHGPKCQIGRLDITSLESIWEFKKSIGGQKINVLLNVAGR